MDRRRFLGYGTAALATCLPGIGLALGGQRQQRWPERALQRVAFGSCNDSEKDQSFWHLIARDKPDLWIWLGDNIYADDLSISDRRSRYAGLLNESAYRQFSLKTPVIGTWDDHDYAFNNADGSYAHKRESQAALLSFLAVPSESPLWQQSGVYQSYTFGEKGQATQVILLDLRSHMNKKKGQLLGAAQWEWLEAEIANSDADLLLIGSSLNVTSPITGIGLEGWNEYGAERRRLYQLLEERRCPTIILSGDRHFAEMSCVMLESGQRVYEFMSSGLTHALGIKFPHPGRLEEMVGRKNYGLLDIDWTGTGPVVRMQVKSTEMYAVYREHVADFS